MPTLTSRQTVELFHLVFARALFAGLKDKSLLAIKGGINLRFYFDSVRFSEGLDLDVAKMAKGTLENRVDRLLESPALISPLKSRGVIVKDVAKPKQTNTTQRWKIGVSIPTTGLEERTKIEFSRRDELAASALDPVQGSIANAYSIPSFLANHYRTTEAARQKIHALAERTEPQPRDVFDLRNSTMRPRHGLRLRSRTRPTSITTPSRRSSSRTSSRRTPASTRPGRHGKPCSSTWSPS